MQEPVSELWWATHSHCRCLMDTRNVLSTAPHQMWSIKDALFQAKDASSMTRGCCVPPWTDRFVSVVSRLSHWAECQISNMTGNLRKMGCTPGRLRCTNVQMGPWWKSWKGDLWVARGGYPCCLCQHLLPCVSPEAAGCSVLASLSSSPMWTIFRDILPSFCCGKIQQQKWFPHLKTNSSNEDKCDFSFIHSKHELLHN